MINAIDVILILVHAQNACILFKILQIIVLVIMGNMGIFAIKTATINVLIAIQMIPIVFIVVVT